MNFGLRADGGQLMNSYDDASTSMSAQQRKLLSYCFYYGFNSNEAKAPSPDSSYSYYERLRDNINSSYSATLPSFASRRTSEAPTYELKWNEGNQRFETTLSDSNGVLSDFDFCVSGYSVDKNGNSITISSKSVNTMTARIVL